MKIVIFALGSRGDVQPYVALGRGLRAAGHTVRLLASSNFYELVTSNGLEFTPLGGTSEAVARDMQQMIEQGQTLKVFSAQARVAEALAREAPPRGSSPPRAPT